MVKNLLIGAVVIVVIIGAVMMFASSNQSGTATQTPSPTTAEMTTDETSPTGEAMAPEEVKIEIKNFAFGPKTITVKKGTTVTWTNQDTVKHDAASDDGEFKTELMGQGESQSVTFDTVGTYNYHCTPHPNMKATIIVTE